MIIILGKSEFIIAFCTIIIMISTVVGVVISNAQLTEVRASSIQAEILAKAAITQAEAAKSLAELARDDLRTRQRARIIPTDIQIMGTVSDGRPIQLAVGFVNTGQDAATEFTIQTYAFLDKQEKSSREGYNARISQIKDQCMVKNMQDFGRTIFPEANSKKHVILDLYQEGTWQNEAIYWKDSILQGSDVVVVPGCMTYHSLDEAHHTFFCYYSLPDQTGSNGVTFAHCDNGHRAD